MEKNGENCGNGENGGSLENGSKIVDYSGAPKNAVRRRVCSKHDCLNFTCVRTQKRNFLKHRLGGL